MRTLAAIDIGTNSIKLLVANLEDDGTLEVKRPNDERDSRSLHGLSRTLIANMVTGVTDGYEKKLEIVGVGYRVVPMRPKA